MAKDNKFYVKPRDVDLKCTKCGNRFTVQVNNIYKDDISDILNCLSCGGKVEIIAIRSPSKSKQYA